MAVDSAISDRLKHRQRVMFRAAADRGFSQKVIHFDTGLSLSVIDEYARGETAMGGPSILALASLPEFPAELISLLFDGTGRAVIDEPADKLIGGGK
jgi:hypothetical protein